MLSVFLLMLIVDCTYIFLSKRYDAVIPMLVMEIVCFLGINWLGIYFLFRPVDRLLSNEHDQKDLMRKVVRLPLYSALWLFFLGLVWLGLVLSAINTYDKPHTTIRYVSIAIELFYAYCIFLGFYGFFIISDFTIKLKEHMFIKFNILLPPERFKIWHKLIISYLVISILPILLILLDLYAVGLFRHMDALMVTNVLNVFTLIIVAVYFITNSFRRPINLLLHSCEQIGRGDYLKTPVVSNDEIGHLMHQFNGMVEGLRDREFIRDTFGKYMTREVVAEILNKNRKLEAEQRIVTILFTDIENYTTITEGLSPVEVERLLNEYFTVIVGIIREHKGIVNKYIGDAVLAIFNAPVNDPDHARHAVQAALEIQRETGEQKFGNGILLKTRIGINTGNVVVGNIGSADRLEYTVIGSEVNVASRLESLNKGLEPQILSSDQTRK